MNLDEAIRAALEFEGGVHRTYLEAVEKTADPAGKRVFQALCDEEMGHVKYLRERLDEWQQTGRVQIQKLETSIPTRTTIHRNLEKLRKQVEGKSRLNNPLELDFLRRALEVEIRASNFYREMVRTLDGDGPKLFARFVEIEEGHLAIVQAEINSVSGLGYWFDTAEFNVEAD
jgi:rubrerythrin